jgi:hypothetical protein
VLAKTGPNKLPARFVSALFLLIVTASSMLLSQTEVQSFSVGDYFSIKYTAQLSDKQISGKKPFHLDITAEALCKNDLPISISNAQITGSIVARHNITGQRLTLVPSYTLDITPFPNRTGETYLASQSLMLQFPSDCPLGSYNIIGETIEAKVKAGIWINVTTYLPPSVVFESIVYSSETASGSLAIFNLSDFSINPPVSPVKAPVTVRVKVSNIGDLQGSYLAILEMNGIPLGSQEVNLAGGTSKMISFSTIGNSPGEYRLSIGDFAGVLMITGSEASAKSDGENRWFFTAIFVLAILDATLGFMFLKRRKSNARDPK